MAGDVVTGISYLKEGFGLILRPGIRLFVVVPVTINILVFVLLTYLFANQFSSWTDAAVAWLPEWLAFLEWLLWLVFAVLIVLFFVYGFVFLTNLIGAPFYGLLSERVEKELMGTASDAPITWKSIALIVPRSVFREIQKLVYYLPRVLGIFVLGFIPGVQVAAPPLSLAFSAWMMAIQYADFAADNQGIGFTQMRIILAKRRLLSASFGGCSLLASMIPLLNIFAMPAAVAGGTALWVREFQSFRSVT